MINRRCKQFRITQNHRAEEEEESRRRNWRERKKVKREKVELHAIKMFFFYLFYIWVLCRCEIAFTVSVCVDAKKKLDGKTIDTRRFFHHPPSTMRWQSQFLLKYFHRSIYSDQFSFNRIRFDVLENRNWFSTAGIRENRIEMETKMRKSKSRNTKNRKREKCDRILIDASRLTITSQAMGHRRSE